MSLYKRLWLAVIFLLAMVFAVSIIVTSLSTREYLAQQLGMKNSDNAGALAISLTQQDVDPVMLELLIAAQFDTGFYELIELADPQGNVAIVRRDEQPLDEAPAWFMRLFPIEVAPGVASVQKGWQQLGTLTLRSHSRFAYRELWESTKKMAVVFIIAMIAAGLIGSYLLRLILRPLNDVVSQARAIGERRFIEIPEPATREFRNLVSSMNSLSSRVRTMLQEEAGRLEQWRRDSHVDPITGLLNREQFIAVLGSTLERDDANASGVIGLLRIGNLAQLNQSYGRKYIDGILAQMGGSLTDLASSNTDWSAFRLNGSDCALIATRATDAVQIARLMQQAFQDILENCGMSADTTLPAAAAEFHHGDIFGELMKGLDAALLAAASEGGTDLSVATRADLQSMPVSEQLANWSNIFEKSFSEQNFSLATFPVIGANGNLLHHESPARLQWQDELISAGKFLPWIHRLDLAGELDKKVVNLALQRIQNDDLPVGVNLSAATISNPSNLLWLREVLSLNAASAGKLWIEVQEPIVYRYIDDFRDLCGQSKAYGTRFGIKHMGHQIASISRLHDVGLDYVKIDPSFVRGIQDNAANQTLLRTLCTLVHSIGLTAIAAGVSNRDEWMMLEGLGFDGVTGPGVEMPGDSNADHLE